MSDQVERFSVLPGGPPIWVRHTDHLAALDKVREEVRERVERKIMDAEQRYLSGKRTEYRDGKVVALGEALAIVRSIFEEADRG